MSRTFIPWRTPAKASSNSGLRLTSVCRSGFGTIRARHDCAVVRFAHRLSSPRSRRAPAKTGQIRENLFTPLSSRLSGPLNFGVRFLVERTHAFPAVVRFRPAIVGFDLERIAEADPCATLPNPRASPAGQRRRSGSEPRDRQARCASSTTFPGSQRPVHHPPSKCFLRRRTGGPPKISSFARRSPTTRARLRSAARPA